MQSGQAFDTFKLLIGGVVALSLLVVLLSVISGVVHLIPHSGFDASKAEISDFAVYPKQSTIGTIFSIKGVVKMESGKIKQCREPARVFVRVGSEEIEMYDDGKHNDGKEKDCTFGALWNSLGRGKGNYSAQMFAVDANGLEVSSAVFTFQVTNNKCALISGEGNSSTKLDIVFVGDKYTDLDTFGSDVEIHSNYLLSTAPFNEYKDRIKIYAVRQFADLGCSVEMGYISCDDDLVEIVASQCPYDEIIVLVNTTEIAGSANPHAYASRLYPEVTVHEFGHSFGPEPINLADEYSYGASEVGADEYLRKAPNCDYYPCNKWEGVPGTSCVHVDKYGREGCTFIEWYKPVEYDPARNFPIMEGATIKERDTPIPPAPVEHDPASIRFIRRLLEEYK
ncbi:MAG: hypothetical protein J7K68_00370 [Candidatus Diapherotrites archaeon]|nr:hypothetical protein [Candidatus Diapherotrites archaeon]